jgi:hypothetical protein
MKILPLNFYSSPVKVAWEKLPELPASNRRKFSFLTDKWAAAASPQS